MKWFPKVVRPMQTTGENGQVLEWHSYFPVIGKLVADPETQPTTEKTEVDLSSEKVDSLTEREIAGQNVRTRWQNTLAASPIYTTVFLFFILPLDIWLPALLRFICHDPSTVPEPKTHLILTVILHISTVLIFTCTACIAFYRHAIADPVIGLFGLFGYPLFALQLIGQTTRFRWPIVMVAAAAAGLSNALFLRKTMDTFNSGVFSASAPSSASTSRKSREILRFLLRLIAKASPSLFVVAEYIYPSSSSQFAYLNPISIEKVYILYTSFYTFQLISAVMAQQFIGKIYPRADCGPLYAIVDKQDWSMEMRVGKGQDPGAIEPKEGRKVEDVRVLQVGGVMAMGFAVVVVMGTCVQG